MTRQSIMAANWKMYKTVAESRAYARELLRRMEEGADIRPQQVIFPTLPALSEVAATLSGSTVQTGAQNLDLGDEGARTGAVSAPLLRAAGARYVIVGHSERRALFGETDALVAEKAAAAVRHHLIPIICVGESQSERERGHTDEVIYRQITAVATLKSFGTGVVAYEPVWAIGTGLLPDPREAGRVAAVIRRAIAQHDPQIADAVRILYGGSINRSNIREFAAVPDLDGALVGGASLDLGHWMELCRGWSEVRL